MVSKKIHFQLYHVCLLILGDNVDCWMEIQQGKGPWASPVNGIVPLGTTLTMVVGIDDKEGKQKHLSIKNDNPFFFIFDHHVYFIRIQKYILINQ